MYDPEKLPSPMEVIKVNKLRRLRCSFCGKDETEVLKLVAGPRVYICGGCVEIASRMMNEPHDDSQPPEGQSSVWRKLLTGVRRLMGSSAARRVGSSGVPG